jgi:glycosyltransferase involved in cell wall biosynthesis
MGKNAVARVLPSPVKRWIRRSARWAAKVRHTRAWPALRLVLRPAYRLARRIVNVDRLLGKPAADAYWADLKIDVTRRRLLNLGLTDRALADLRGLAADQTNPYLRRLAAGELALWHADQYREPDARQALEYLRLATAGERDPARLRQLAVMTAECHQLTGDLGAAQQAIAGELAVDDPDPNVLLAAANLEPDPARRVALFNRALAHHGLSGVSLRTPVTGTALDRLTAAGPVEPALADGPVVTVIVPAYNAADTIRTALDALLAQTWPHLEILVVDDASTDQTAAVVTEHAQRDPRVRLIRAERNGGTYVARNLALREATGEFVTCHDTDDWSHPEKLERQVRHLLGHPDVVANTSQQARATPDLTFHRRGKPGYFVFMNLSSLMFRRIPVMEALGYWDSVRFGADAELQRRMKRAFGEPAVVNLRTGPLCLQRQSASSLTGNQAFGYHGYFMGARKDYFESYGYHQRNAESLRYEFPQPTRPFPVPASMLPDRPTRERRRHFDVIIASDFRLVGGSTVSSLEEVKVQRRLGLRTGLIQMAYYDADSRRSVTPKVRDALDGDQVQMIVHGEQVSCDLLIVRYPPVLQEWQRFLPDVAAEHVRVIVNQPPMSDYGPDAALRYRIPRCHEHLQKYFGQPGVWHPIGPLVRQALHEHHAGDLPAIELSDEDWVNVIDVDAWRRPSRPPRGPRVRIGRHSRDHELKWPATPADLLAVYPDSPAYEVHVLGGGRTPLSILGRQPEHWHVRDFGQIPPAEFLAGVDVFVYYPHPQWVESFGRVILEAMAAGVPVVLPPTFRPLFGDAAIYAAPAEALARVDQLMQDDDYYSTRADQAQRFVEKGFGYSKHAERIARFLNR